MSVTLVPKCPRFCSVEQFAENQSPEEFPPPDQSQSFVLKEEASMFRERCMGLFQADDASLCVDHLDDVGCNPNGHTSSQCSKTVGQPP